MLAALQLCREPQNVTYLIGTSVHLGNVGLIDFAKRGWVNLSLVELAYKYVASVRRQAIVLQNA
jgi:hypothetical protein